MRKLEKRTILRLLLLILPMQLFAQGTWKRMADFPVMDRSTGDRINSFVIDQKLYVLYNRDQTKETEVWMFDPNSNTWTAKNYFPGPPQQIPFCIGIGNKGYYGLGTYFSGEPLGLWEYEPTTDTWTPKAVPSKTVYGSTSFTINGKGYFGLGYNGYEIWEYYPDSNSWREFTSYPSTPVHAPIVFKIGNRIYMGGGSKNQWRFNDFFSFDPFMNQWKRKYNMPTSNITIGFGICQNGYGISYERYDFQLYRYDYVWDIWNNIGTSPKMYAAISISIENKAYIGLGTDTLSNPSNILWEYTPSDSCKQVTGIEKIIDLDLTIFPNPMGTESYLQISNPMNEPFTFNLYQSNGLLVRTENGYANEPLKIKREFLANGLYFYIIKMGSKQAVGKLLLE